MTTISLEGLVRPFQGEESYPRPYYLQGQRTAQPIKLKYGGSGSMKTLSTSESATNTKYCARHEVEKSDQNDGD